MVVGFGNAAYDSRRTLGGPWMHVIMYYRALRTIAYGRMTVSMMVNVELTAQKHSLYVHLHIFRKTESVLHLKCTVLYCVY